MLAEAYQHVVFLGLRIGNLDCIVFAEKPKLAPYKQELRERVSEILTLNVGHICIKAKTGEGVDAVGQQKAISAQCVALLEKIES